MSARVGAALLTLLVFAASACGRETGGDARSQAPPVEKQACSADVPAQWRDAIAASAVDAGGLTTSPRSVGPAGEVVAVRDSGQARDLLLVGTDKSVRELYTLPEPDVYVFGYVGIDERWIVFATEHLPRNANGVLPQVERIEVMDRQTGTRRTVAEQSAADADSIPERNVLDAVVLSNGKVYWITRDEYNGDTGVAHEFDPSTGAGTEIASGSIRDIQAGPQGAAWTKPSAALPPAVAELSSAELAKVGTDGSAYGWISGTGVGYWSAQTGVVKVAGLDVDLDEFRGPVLVFDSYVILDAGGSTTYLDTSAVVVDTRSGAVVTLGPRNPRQYDRFVASMGGTAAMDLWAGPGRETKQEDHAVGVLRSGALSAPAC